MQVILDTDVRPPPELKLSDSRWTELIDALRRTGSVYVENPHSYQIVTLTIDGGEKRAIARSADTGRLVAVTIVTHRDYGWHRIGKTPEEWSGLDDEPIDQLIQTLGLVGADANAEARR
jgi:hypothetical protein